MSRQALATVAVLALVLLGGAAAFAEEPKAKTYYFATIVGDRLAYTQTSEGVATEVVEEVASVSSKGGIVVVETKRIAGDRTGRTMTHEVSDKGLYHVAVNSEFLRSRMCVLELPAKKGDTWPVKMTLKESEPSPGQRAEETDVSGTATVVATDEDLTVPAGRFKCIHVQTSFEMSGYMNRMTVWVAPGIGVVRTALECGESVDRLHTAMDLTLKSFTPGRKN